MKVHENQNYVANKLGVGRFATGYRDVFDYQLNQHKKMSVNLMWLIEIEYQSCKASLGCIKTSDWQQVILVPVYEYFALNPVRISTDLDTVTPALEQVNLVPDDRFVLFEARGYTLHTKIVTTRMETTFVYTSATREHNSDSMNVLWDGIHSLTNHIVRASENEQLTKFVDDNWWNVPL